MIVLVAHYEGQPGHGDRIEEGLRRMAACVREEEPGCALYHVCRDRDNPDNFLLYEHYVDERALTAHRETAHFRDILEATVIPLLAKRERELYDLVLG